MESKRSLLAKVKDLGTRTYNLNFGRVVYKYSKEFNLPAFLSSVIVLLSGVIPLFSVYFFSVNACVKENIRCQYVKKVGLN